MNDETFRPVADPAVTHKLKKPIRYLNNEITEVAFREPVAFDISQAGDPIKITSFDPFVFEIDEAKMFRMMSQLSGLPFGGTLSTMKASDTKSISYKLAPFFIPE